MLINKLPAENLPHVYSFLQKLNLETDAFSQLTREYMQEEFNPNTPDVDGIRSVIHCLFSGQSDRRSYYSYGSSIDPSWYSSFRIPHDIVKRLEDSPNDGLVR
jgi:triacylglycerol lipase